MLKSLDNVNPFGDGDLYLISHDNNRVIFWIKLYIGT